MEGDGASLTRGVWLVRLGWSWPLREVACIGIHAIGTRNVAIIRSREVATNQGFLKHNLNGYAVGSEEVQCKCSL